MLSAEQKCRAFCSQWSRACGSFALRRRMRGENGGYLSSNFAAAVLIRRELSGIAILGEYKLINEKKPPRTTGDQALGGVSVLFHVTAFCELLNA